MMGFNVWVVQDVCRRHGVAMEDRRKKPCWPRVFSWRVPLTQHMRAAPRLEPPEAAGMVRNEILMKRRRGDIVVLFLDILVKVLALSAFSQQVRHDVLVVCVRGELAADLG